MRVPGSDTRKRSSSLSCPDHRCVVEPIAGAAFFAKHDQYAPNSRGEDRHEEAADPRLKLRNRPLPLEQNPPVTGPGRVVQASHALVGRCSTVLGMAKAARVLAALKRDGWIETRHSGSHRVLAKGNEHRIGAYHDGADLGGPTMARIARDYGYTLAELRKL